jgi:hypothetical protein
MWALTPLYSTVSRTLMYLCTTNECNMFMLRALVNIVDDAFSLQKVKKNYSKTIAS